MEVTVYFLPGKDTVMLFPDPSGEPFGQQYRAGVMPRIFLMTIDGHYGIVRKYGPDIPFMPVTDIGIVIAFLPGKDIGPSAHGIEKLIRFSSS